MFVEALGQQLCVVTKTGINTYIGRAANLISSTHDAGHFQAIVNNIGNFLIIISLVTFITFEYRLCVSFCSCMIFFI
jgi:magnesium-transporting ATPase (P-type)